MGEIADMMLEGILDEQTGEYIGEAVGYPRTKQKGFYNSIGKSIGKKDKNKNVGGEHLIGKTFEIEDIGECQIIKMKGKRGARRYMALDSKGKRRYVKFSKIKFKKS